MPVVLVMMLVIKRQNTNRQSGEVVSIPWFLIAFVALMLLNSFVSLPAQLIDYSTYISRFALITAITAIGMKSNLAKLSSVGITPIILIIAETLWIALFILGAIYF
jgi:uncharacterized membrane protein YadS